MWPLSTQGFFKSYIIFRIRIEPRWSLFVQWQGKFDQKGPSLWRENQEYGTVSRRFRSTWRTWKQEKKQGKNKNIYKMSETKEMNKKWTKEKNEDIYIHTNTNKKNPSQHFPILLLTQQRGKPRANGTIPRWIETHTSCRWVFLVRRSSNRSISNSRPLSRPFSRRFQTNDRRPKVCWTRVLARPIWKALLSRWRTGSSSCWSPGRRGCGKLHRISHTVWRGPRSGRTRWWWGSKRPCAPAKIREVRETQRQRAWSGSTGRWSQGRQGAHRGAPLRPRSSWQAARYWGWASRRRTIHRCSSRGFPRHRSSWTRKISPGRNSHWKC